MRAIVVALAALALAGTGATVSPQPSPDPADLARRLQARYQTIRDFTAEFSQTYQGLLLRKPTTERGMLQVKKPNRLRFTYSSPERKIFVSDGTQFYSYYPADRAGSVHALPKPDEAPTALLFLAGRGDLVRDFTASLPAPQPDGEWHLRLVPRAPNPDFDTLTLLVDRRTLALAGFITVDAQGTNTMRFSRLRENTGLSDSAFHFSFPPGTDVIR